MIKLTEQTLFADRYLFKRLLGRGGFSEVWLATDKMTGLEIAVKVYAPGQGMDTDGMKDFCKELSQVYNLNHTNLLKPQHVDNWEGMPYLVMTYCQKGSCQRLIGTMSEEQIWKMLHDVSSGLAYLHEQGIIHQDIKPDNILVDNAGHYVITDFGISVQSRSTLRKSMNIASGSGTTAYMGPERFSADPTPLKASDIWSLGATAYELLTGNAPFGEIGGGLQKGGADLPTIKQSISSELRMVLAKMLAMETWDRPTAEQIAKWAENPGQIDFAGQQKTQRINNQSFATNPSPVSSRVPAKSKKGLIIGIVAAALVLIAGGLTFLLKKGSSGPTPEEIKTATQKRIEIQIAMGKECDKYISDLNARNIIDRLDITVEQMRRLERFESDTLWLKDAPIVCARKMSPEKMKSFRGKLAELHDQLENSLKSSELDGCDKKGNLYQGYVRKIERIDAVFDDIDNSTTKSAMDIHLRSDEF